VIRISDLEFRYPDGAFTLRMGNLHVEEGERVCITGASGSGKTTLVNLVAGILKPTSGSVRVADTEISRRNDRRNRAFRIDNIGFIFQNFELLEYLPVEENILLPFSVGGRMKADAAVRERMSLYLEEMGMTARRRAYPRRLSQGEKQRVAICRAMINRPRLVIADEPTANLDTENAKRVMDLIAGVLDENGSTFLMVSHDRALLPHFDRRLDMGELATREADPQVKEAG